jgi:hypothetical protein
MKKILALALTGATVIAVTAVAIAANNPQRSDTMTADCINSLTGQNEGTFTYEGVVVAWPPNHKYRNASVTLTDTDGDPMNMVSVAVAGTHDQVLEDGSEMNGSGNTDPATDTTPGAGTGANEATANFQFRGERSGRDKTGRTYTFTTTGSTDNGTSTCDPVEFEAVVPHDQRKAK